MRTTFDEVLRQSGTMILDGAMATELEAMGCDLNDSLWSAKVLAEAPELIMRVHRSYFEAGADCGMTASYQATIDGYCKKGYTVEEAEGFICRSVELLLQARKDWWEQSGRMAGRVYPLVAAAVGPYGAYLADGSEYRGNYGVSAETLEQFHRRRMALLWGAGAEILAIETIPSLEEAEVCARLAEEMNFDCWISFSCKSETEICDGTPIRQCGMRLEQYDAVKAISINCTAPHLVANLVQELKKSTTKPILVYPNSGETYDAVTKTWHGSADGCTYGDFARQWKAAGAVGIGGCCRTTPADIRQVADVVRSV